MNRKHSSATKLDGRFAKVILAGLFAWAALFLFAASSRAQTTATITGTVTDAQGGIVAGANVVLTNEANNDHRDTVSNDSGYFAFPAVLPGSYALKIEAKGFKGWQQSGIAVDASDQRKISGIVLEVGVTSESVTVVANDELIPVDSGERKDVLTSKDIDQLPLSSRNVDELLKTLTGVADTPLGGLSNTVPNFFNQGAEGSSVGNGLAINGAAERGGTGQLADGVDINDPGCNCYSIAAINPEMTQEVTVQTSNFGADSPKGPTVVNTISKSGTSEYHGAAYLYARNYVLDANDWQSKENHLARNPEHYYYPGANLGGPFPFTHKKLFFWFGYEHFLQNLGNSSLLQSYIPSPGMLAGNFTSSGQGNAALCPNLDANGNDTSASPISGTYCASVNGTVLPNGQTVTNGMIPAQYLDPGAAALAKIWPAANADPATTPGGYNYVDAVPALHNGYTLRARVDYNLNDSNKFYVSYQLGNDSQVTQGNGAHIYWTPAYSIPYPGGGLQSTSTSKALSGHFVHVFSPSLTNELIATWGYGNNPVGPPDPTASFRSTLGYPYGTVFNTGAQVIPSYSSAGKMTFPDFSEQDIFEAGNGVYLVRKEQPSFADNVVKVWGTHTIKIGAFTETADNAQGSFESPNGSINSFSGENHDLFTGNELGSPLNPTANFVLGVVSSYSENSAGPVEDLAARNTAAYIDDSWKVTKQLTVEAGFRFDHISHWYDRGGNGIPVWIPGLVDSDAVSGKIDPGLYWHGINPGIPTSGNPNKIVWVEPRFGVAYDLFGNGKTVLRGGWGAYRFNDQYNDYANALVQADSIQTYNLPGQTNVLLSQIPSIVPSVNGGVGSVTAFSPTDNQIPVTHSYNFTISQQLPWRSLFEIAYVGSSTDHVLMGGGSDAASSSTGGGSYVDQNKIPLGALFLPDPVTGTIASNPENVQASGNSLADYAPYGKVYGTNTIAVPTHVGYANYNALQTSWNKRSEHLTFNLNFTWSKTLGTVLNVNPFVLRDNYGPDIIDRPFVLNASYAYNFLKIYHGDSKWIGGTVNGWTVSGFTAYDSGAPLQSLMGNSNFGLALTYTGLPAGAPASLTNAIGDPTYYGTTAAIAIQPITTCDPGAGLANNQTVKVQCLAPPAIGTYGDRNYDVHGPAYWNSDLSLYKTFHIKERHALQFRVSAFNFLNHPLPQYSGGGQLTLDYNVDYTTHAFTLSPSTSPTFGFLDSKSGAPSQRIMELSVRYSF
jgi:Carboxypeptidase regulatory-like domain